MPRNGADEESSQHRGAALAFGREPLGKDEGRARRRLAEDDVLADAVAAAIAAAPPRVGPTPPHCPVFAL